MNFVWTQRLLPLLLTCMAATAFAEPAVSTPGAYAPRVDERGYIDIRAFLEQAALALRAAPDVQPDRPCAGVAKQGASVSGWEQMLQEQAAARQCAGLQNVLRRQAEAERSTFSVVWMPVLQAAARRGDRVAEVLLLQCSTTPALVRQGFDSTCDPDEQRVTRASKRLLELGFAPAYHYPLLLNSNALRSAAAAPQQNRLLQAQLQGALGAVLMEQYQAAINAAGYRGSAPFDRDVARQGALIEALLQQAPRGFTFPQLNDGLLALNRGTALSTSMTWGRGLLPDDGSLTLYSWQGRPREYHDCGPDGGVTLCTNWLMGSDRRSDEDKKAIYSSRQVYDPAFGARVDQLLVQMERNINAALKAEPRWAAFLVLRKGHHEFVPADGESRAGQLDAAWAGDYVLERHYVDRLPQAMAAPVHAHIDVGSKTSISIRSAAALPPPIENTEACELRYSGGMSQRKSAGRGFPWFFELDIKSAWPRVKGIGAEQRPEPFASFDPNKRYKQVLMLCREGESLNRERARFLFLTGDVVFELAVDNASMAMGTRTHMRLFRRVPTPAL